MPGLCKAPLRTAPQTKKSYNADFIRETAKNKWLDIWDELGIRLANNKCPICNKINSFKIDNDEVGLFSCTACYIKGDGIGLIEVYFSENFHDAVERVARNLRLRPREVQS